MANVQTQFSTDPNSIVTVNVSIIEAPTPITYQRIGALVSFGATTLTPAGSTTLLTQIADLTQWAPPQTQPLIQLPIALTSLTWAGSVVTVNTTTPLPGPPTIGDSFIMVINGAA